MRERGRIKARWTKMDGILLMRRPQGAESFLIFQDRQKPPDRTGARTFIPQRLSHHYQLWKRDLRTDTCAECAPGTRDKDMPCQADRCPRTDFPSITSQTESLLRTDTHSD